MILIDEASKEPRYPEHVAKAIVRKVDSHVNAMIGSSQLVEGHWRCRDDTLGLFDKQELELGRLLGSGGFSDVYEVVGFRPKEDRWFPEHLRKARSELKRSKTDRGKAKYVVKHLKVKMMGDASKFCMAAADLVVEAQYLSSLDHENILKIRGWSLNGIESYSNGKHNGYFLILDRLEDTLDKRIELWKRQSLDFSRGPLRLSVKGCMSDMLLSRTQVAHQVASALNYLHSKNIVFRDLKPNNVGFDENGTVKIFDFGLSRELPKPCVNVNDVYHMSGKIGTVRYMAPEVALSKGYNQKVDTYSWSMLFWQLLTLERPYAEMTRDSHQTRVCHFGERPELRDEWPDSIQRLLERSWSQDMYTRITMLEVCAYLERIEDELQSNLNVSKVIERSGSFVMRPPKLIRNTSKTIMPMAA